MKWRIKNTVNSTRLKLVMWYENDSSSFKPELAELVPVGYFPLLTYEKFVLQSIINNPYALAILAKESSKGCSFWQGKSRQRAQFAEMIELLVLFSSINSVLFTWSVEVCTHKSWQFFYSSPFDYMNSANDIQSWTWKSGVMEVNVLTFEQKGSL